MRKLIVVLLILLPSFNYLNAQVDTAANYPNVLQWITNVAEKGMDMITFKQENHTFLIIPTMGYENSTGLAFGLMPTWRFRTNNSSDGDGYCRTSNISPSVMFSTTGMYEVELSSDFYTKNNWLIKSDWYLQSLRDRFYSIGNQRKGNDYTDFDMRKIEFKGSVAKGLNRSVFVGVDYDLAYFRTANYDNSFLNKAVRGFNGGAVYGVGPTVIYDTRDDVSYPSRGKYFVLTYNHYFGDYNFSTMKADFRTYYKIGDGDKVIALQAYLNSASGDIPFFRMPVLGGKTLFRGIDRPYKYMDKNATYVQVEYRSPLWWRLGYVVNAGLGNVFNEWDSSTLKDVHVLFGGGFRFQLTPGDKLNLRADFEMTNRGDRGIYFTLGEAF